MSEIGNGRTSPCEWKWEGVLLLLIDLLFDCV